MVKWKSLRDRFVRELKKAKQDHSGDSGTSFTSPWSQFNALLFLQDSVRHRGRVLSARPCSPRVDVDIMETCIIALHIVLSVYCVMV